MSVHGDHRDVDSPLDVDHDSSDITKHPSRSSGPPSQPTSNNPINHESLRTSGNTGVYDEVMKFVSGSFDDKAGPRKRAYSSEEPMTQIEFQQWTSGFLNDVVNEESGQGNDDEGWIALQKARASGKSKLHGSHVADQSVGSAGAGVVSTEDGSVHSAPSKIDPELGVIDATIDANDSSAFEHDSLIDARTLASLGGLDQEYLRNGDKKTTSGHIPTPEEEVRHLAVQAVAAAAAAVGGGEGGNEHDEEKKVKDKVSDSDPDVRIALLIDSAVAKARNLVPEGPQGKSFSKQEMEALDTFIRDYCGIKGLTLDDIRHRVWGNERIRDTFWKTVQKVLPYRSRASLYKHVRRTYHVFKVRGKWTEEDDEKFAALASKYEGKWRIIGLKMGRMPEDCRDRWRNYIKCGDKRRKNKWEPEEEEKLEEVVRGMSSKETINWTKVSERMGGTRSRIQCRYKWNKLKKREESIRLRKMDLDTKVWLLSRLREIWYHERSDVVDWNALATIFPGNAWTGKDFESCYERMKASVDQDGKSFIEIVEALLQGYTPPSYIGMLRDDRELKIPGLVMRVSGNEQPVDERTKPTKRNEGQQMK
ncbi:DEKNAAC100933 [Brettanomyces naardenensis]|uniref:DEKNAAC100933 n=1 Tax=Brettanomyces naardenensis TaxID=13370 RepID=A0A448YH19_BRENA|nr:DEKNAAC100933 [Brettanomyces naardenensis]